MHQCSLSPITFDSGRVYMHTLQRMSLRIVRLPGAEWRGVVAGHAQGFSPSGGNSRRMCGWVYQVLHAYTEFIADHEFVLMTGCRQHAATHRGV